jgi:hypothetical protein
MPVAASIVVVRAAVTSRQDRVRERWGDDVDATVTARQPTTLKSSTGTRRRRGVLSGLALVLACLTIVLATVGLWVHQVVLNTDRFTALASNIVTDPAVIDPVATRVSQQVVTALGVEERIANRLPDAVKPLAGSITVSVQEAIDKRLDNALQDPRVQAALVNTLAFTHERVVALLRGEVDAISVSNGYVQLDVFPVIGKVLEQLQAIGIIPANVTLPDLTTDEAPAALAARLQSALGVTLPPDFGTIQLMPADRLTAAQTVVKAFDIIVVALIALAVVLVALALWLARDRRRMVVYLALGTVIAFVLIRFSARSLPDAVTGGIADKGLAGALRSVMGSVAADLIGVTTIILVVTAALCVVAYVAGRPRWLVRLTSRSTGVVYVGATRTAAAASDVRSRTDTTGLVRENRAAVERIGIGAIAFVVAWLAIGLEVALLGLALVVAWLLIVRIVADEPATTTADSTAAIGPSASSGPGETPVEAEAVTAT